MKLLIFLISMLVLTPYAFSSDDGFVLVRGDYKIIEGSSIAISEPPYRSQDTVGLCYGLTAASAYDIAYCKNIHINCTDLPDDQKVSSIAMSSYSSKENKKEDPQIKSTSAMLAEVSISEGGSAAEALAHAVFISKRNVKESCAPFDKIVSMLGSEKEIHDLQSAAWENLRRSYQAFRDDFNGCNECAMKDAQFAAALEKTKIDFKLNRTNEKVLKAFGARTYSEFLGQLLVPGKCDGSSQQLYMESALWSLNSDPKSFSKFDSSITKMKEILKKGNPLIVDGYCTMEILPSSASKCNAPHSFLITGYRKVCKPNSVCRDLVKVHNSWGQSWQDSHDGGWVDAKAVLDRTFYHPGAFHWLEEK